MIIITITDQYNTAKAVKYQATAVMYMVPIVLTVITENRVPRTTKRKETRMWANAQPDGRPAEHRWRPLFNAAKFA